MTGFNEATRQTIHDRADSICELCGAVKGVEIHHRRPRAHGGSKAPDTNQAANGLLLCMDCHRLCERHRRVAVMLGWLVPQGFDPVLVPVIRRGDWVFLTAEGGVRDTGTDFAEPDNGYGETTRRGTRMSNSKVVIPRCSRTRKEI